jgi:hypothetical protein
MQGLTLPTSTEAKTTGPLAGAYEKSPLELLLGGGAAGIGTLAGISDLLKPYTRANGTQSTAWQDLLDQLKNLIPT